MFAAGEMVELAVRLALSGALLLGEGKLRHLGPPRTARAEGAARPGQEDAPATVRLQPSRPTSPSTQATTVPARARALQTL